ncbi:S-adenosyl-L-methionine-dependent methyltransferase [Xylariaceae sp. FL0255]|nr:S-adenosyl-L-methionine-dependent methyltransferase [Xylariaceae sp. FL0255]
MPFTNNTSRRSVISDWLTERTSLTLDSCADQYLWEGGRRFHFFREGRYHLPNDELQQQREELLHILVEDLLEHRLFLAPMSQPPTKVMDIATGSGLWAIEMGDRYPESEISGIDLSPIQPTLVPPNVSFQVDDVEDTWVHDNDYDFIHICESVAYMRNSADVTKSAFDHLKPGGYVDIQEFHWKALSEDGSDDPLNLVNIYIQQMSSAGASEGLFIPRTPQLDTILSAAGFEDIQFEVFRVPWGGTWHPDPVARKRGAVLCMTA